jgi:hypothetical protein
MNARMSVIMPLTAIGTDLESSISALQTQTISKWELIIADSTGGRETGSRCRQSRAV